MAYFCGQREICMEYGTKFALRKAKENIEMYYPVVTILERLEESRKLCEQLLPQFFKGSISVWLESKGKKNFTMITSSRIAFENKKR